MTTREIVLRAMCCGMLVASLAGSARGTDDDQSWDALKKLTHKNSIYFWLKSSDACVLGQLRDVTNTSVQIDIGNGNTRTIERADILKVGDYLGPDFNFLYVARNSWLDVMALHAVKGTNERVRVVTRKGEKREGQVVTVNDKEITLKVWNKAKTIARVDVASVDYVRYKPASDGAEYLMSEGVLVTPETWIYAMGLQPKVSVRVFDGTKPENNVEIKCKWGSITYN